MKLSQYVLEEMFEKSLFSDLSLAFYHSDFPFTMRFDVHKAIVAQSPFFNILLNNTERLTKINNSKTAANTSTSTSKINPTIDQSKKLYLTIDLVEAMTRRGFIKAPFDHIIRRRWQKPIIISSSTTTTKSNNNSVVNRMDNNDQPQHILSSHIRFVLKWLYVEDRIAFVKQLKDEDTLRVLSIAVLFELESLVQTCLQRYTTHLLSISTINRDLEIICQLPRHHSSYHRLRDAALLLLLRYGPDHPRMISRLPVDYMSDILNADLLFVGCEYERYCLLREVLVAFMQSVGKITWTTAGPVDQDSKRLSGFLRKPLKSLSTLQSNNKNNNQYTSKQQQYQQLGLLSPSVVRQSSKKRKRIPSEELVDELNGSDNNKDNDDNDAISISSSSSTFNQQKQQQPRKIARLSFSARIPFEKLVADASSGGVIDKATIISYLLRTTVIYSNMTFDQLSIVRQDGIVDESIVFRALWQREALERVLFPFSFQQSQSRMITSSPPLTDPTSINSNSQSSIITTTNTSTSTHKKTTIIPRYGKLDTALNNNNNNNKDTQENKQIGMERQAALDEYFDVDGSDSHERRRRILLGVPRYRFSTSVQLTSPMHDNGWKCMNITNDNKKHEEYEYKHEQQQQNSNSDDNMKRNIKLDDEEEESDVDDDDDVEKISENTTGNKRNSTTTNETLPTTSNTTSYQKIYNKTIYSESEYILGHWYRVRVEVQILPKSLMFLQDDSHSTTNNEDNVEKNEEDNDANVIACRFELQRDSYVGNDLNNNTTIEFATSFLSQQNDNHNTIQEKNENRKENNEGETIIDSDQDKDGDNDKESMSTNDHLKNAITQKQDSKIRYSIYCLNRHEAVVSYDYIDPEDRVLIPVSEVTESKDSSEPSTGYVGQIVLDERFINNEKNTVDIDMIVVLEIFGITKV